MENKVKKVILFVLFTILTVSAFGQQTLWSTLRGSNEKYVPLNNVAKEVLNFYDQYKFYYDFSGFNKDRFIEYFDYGFDDWEWLYEIENLTVFALRSNSGHGSVVLIMCISKENVNTIVFSNTLEQDFIMTYSSDRDKFTNWFKTLLN
jgi:hypothetical protein